MSGFALPYLPTVGSWVGLRETLLHIAPELAIALAYWAREGANPRAVGGRAAAASGAWVNANGAVITENAIGKTQDTILAARKAQNAAGKPPPDVTGKDSAKPGPPTRWGALGDTVFDILSGPTALSSSEGAAYVQHKVMGAKPHVQFAAPELQTVSLTLAWHSMLMGDIEKKHRELLDAMNGRKVVPLVIGDKSAGTYPGGNYVITSVKSEIERFWESGKVRSLELTVELLEWNEGGALEPGSHSNAAAVAPGGGNTPAQNSSPGGDNLNDDGTVKK